MRRWIPVLAFLAMAALFLIYNRGAYRGWFDGDDLDNISWSRELSAGEIVSTIVNPVTGGHSFRAVGQLMYAALGRTDPLKFPLYIAWIHILHLLTAIVVYFLLRQLGFALANALIGVAFFAFDMAVFDIYWKPMYVFDLSCGLFCALTLLTWLRGQWLLALVCFWIAFKCKEVAVMLPFVLALYEILFGTKRWKPLVPFFAIAALLVLQAALANLSRNNDYTLHFTVGALKTTISYYIQRAWFVPFLALAAYKDRRTPWGFSIVVIMLGPLLFLPGRLFDAYLYVPMLGLPIVAAAVPTRIALLALLVWLPWNFVEMRHKRVPLIAGQHLNFTYANTVSDFIRANGPSRAYVFDGTTPDLHPWGVIGLMRLMAPGSKTVSVDEPEAPATMRESSMTVMRWYPQWLKLGLIARSPATPDVPYIAIGEETPEWQLLEGWYGYEGHYRWCRPRALASLRRPSGAREFEIKVLVGEQLIAADKQVRVRLVLNGQYLGEHVFVTHGWQTAAWPLKDSYAGPVTMELIVDPVFQGSPDGSRPLGVAVGGFGFK